MILIVVAILLTVCAVAKPQSIAVTKGIFLLMWALFGWNSSNGDYEAYQIIFDDSVSTFLALLVERKFYEIGFTGLNSAFKIVGFDFQDFLIFYAIIPLSLLYYFIEKQSSVPAAVSILFFWFFFPLDYVLMRNFLAFTIFVSAITYIVNSVRPSIPKFTTIVIVACLFHASSIFYLTYNLVLKKKGFVNFRKSIVVVVMIILGYILLKMIGANDLIDQMSQGRREYYGSSLKTVFSLALIQGFFTVTILYATAKLKSYSPSEKTLNFSRLIVSFNIINLALIAFYVDYAILVRLFRHACFLNCVLLLEIAYIMSTVKRSQIILKVIYIYIILFMFLLFCYAYFIYPVIDLTILPLFYENSIFL